MLPPDGNNARVRPVARGIEQTCRGGCSYPEGTAGRCPSPDDSARHGNVRHTRSGLAAGSCLYRKLDSTIMVMKSAEDGRRYDAPHVLDRPMDRCVLIERPMCP